MKCAAVIVENRFDPAGIIAAHKRFLPSDWKVIHINEPCIKNSQDYTNLLTSLPFWENLAEFERVLIFQHDSGLLRTGIEAFLPWDYVGAPWRDFLPYGGNGGLSIRSVQAMIKVIQEIPYSSEMGAEDVYFCRGIMELGLNMAPAEVCSEFSCEQVYRLGTLGYHDIDECLAPWQSANVRSQAFKTVEELDRIHVGSEAWIVGKGPSLQLLKASDFGPGPILTLNEAVLHVEPLEIQNPIYSIQKDGASPRFPNKCQCLNKTGGKCEFDMVHPSRSVLLVHELESIQCMRGYSPRLTFNNERMGIKWHDPSIFSALKMAQIMGCHRVNLLCFDSITHNSNNNFTPGIGPGAGNYTLHNEWLLKVLEWIPHRFITPE